MPDVLIKYTVSLNLKLEGFLKIYKVLIKNSPIKAKKSTKYLYVSTLFLPIFSIKLLPLTTTLGSSL